MTKREFMEQVIAVVEDEKLVEFAKAEIEKLDTANAKRSKRRAEKAKENEPIKAEIREVIGEDKLTASEIAEKTEYSTQKISALCRQMVEDEILKVEDVKIPKKGVRKVYSIA